MMNKRLIVGLGNPGLAYKETRHNMGFKVVQAFAEEKGFAFRQSSSVKGELTQGNVGEEKVFLLLPTTYMNNSGEAVKLCLNYFDISLDDMLVVADDISLPFGKIRMKPQGSSGGHNGLNSIETHVRTKYYKRLRVGIGDREYGDLSDHVIGRFNAEESLKLPEIVKQAVSILEIWVTQGIAAAMQSANQEGEKNG